MFTATQFTIAQVIEPTEAFNSRRTDKKLVYTDPVELFSSVKKNRMGLERWLKN